MSTPAKNLFVLGEDPFNQQHHLKPLSRAYGFNFHCLTSWSKSSVEARPVRETLDEARRRLKLFDGSVDGIITFFDFPVSLIAPILCREFGLPSPSVEAVFRCEHKYWSRLLQREAAPEVVPPFGKLDPQEAPETAWTRLEGEGLRTPFWMKPAKGVLGELAFRIENREQFDSAMAEAKEKIGHFSGPMDELMAEAEVTRPDEFGGEAANRLFVVEQDVQTPLSCTVEGHRFEGETHIHGIVDSFRYPDRMAFHRLQYPSKLPESVQQRMSDASARIMEQIGYDGGAFNIEYFWDREQDRLWLLEINPRISQSHAPQFRLVDGDANMKVLADLALGQRPQLVHGEGRYKIAAKLMLRIFVNDGIVTRIPGEADIEAVRQRFPGTLITPSVELGQHLSEQAHVDNYSWQLAQLYMGARNEEELLTHFNEAVDMLGFKVEGTTIDMPSPRDVTVETED